MKCIHDVLLNISIDIASNPKWMYEHVEYYYYLYYFHLKTSLARALSV